MNDALIIGLVNNTALLLATGVLYSAVSPRPLRAPTLQVKIISGLVIGVVAVAIMLNTVPFGGGVVFDTRSILLSICALFFGPVPTLIAAALAIIYRFSLGGVGAWTGVAVILASAGIGLAWRNLRRTETRRIAARELYLFGLLVHAVMLLCMLTLPWQTALNVLRQISLPVMLLYPLGALLLGMMISNQRARLEIEEALTRNITNYELTLEALQDSEQKYRSLFQSLTTGFALHEIICDKDGEPVDYRFLEVNPTFESMTDLKAQDIIGKTVGEVLPGIGPDWIQACGRVALTGEAIQFENFNQDLNRYYEVSAYSTQPGQFATLILDVTERKEAELEIERSREQLRALNNYMQTAIENERAAISREIHDEFGQILTAIKMDLSWLRRGADVHDPQNERLEEMIALVDDAIRIIRRISSNLRPGVLDDLGLAAALEWQAQEFERRYGIACSIYLPDQELDLPSDLSIALFRIFQEALTNIARHARATRVSAGLSIDQEELVLVVSDDGVGIPGEELLDPNSLGLLGMRERAARWEGRITIDGMPERGTSVTTRIPYPALEKIGGRL